jgi:hypothetical protein
VSPHFELGKQQPELEVVKAMQNHETRTCDLLAALGKAITSCPVEHKARLFGYILRLGRLLRDDPLASSALEELTRRDDADDSALAARVTMLENEARGHVERLASLLGAMSGPAKQALFANSHVSSGRQPREFRDLLRKIDKEKTTKLGLADLDHFRTNVLPSLRESLATLAANDPAVPALFQEVERLEVSGAAAKQVRDAEEILRRLSTRRVSYRLFQFLEIFESTLAQGSSSTVESPDNLPHDLPFIIEMLIAQIQEGVARRYAVYRLRVLFEHFLREFLRLELGREETENEMKPQRERILQRHMDEFLFREGYFPLTHSEASAGYTDTVLLDSVESKRIPPLLIELKQAVSITKPASVRATDVAAAVASARGEVRRYNGHFASRLQWRDITPMIVVVHSCRTDVSSLDAPDVVTIDISDRTPSGKLAARSLTDGSTE